jgi:hypothetical protein
MKRWSDFAAKMLICARAILRAMEGCEKVHVGSPNSHLSAVCSDQDDDERKKHCMSKARDPKKHNEKKKPQKTLKEKRQVMREKQAASPGG